MSSANPHFSSAILGFTEHDHSLCVAGALAAADRLCNNQQLRLTPVRRRVLEILLESHSALGAYDVLARLDSEGLGSKPPIVYRALGFLLENGFVHRIEKLNAYIACTNPGKQHDPAFMLCMSCGSVAETTTQLTVSQLGKTAAQSGFIIEHTVVEAEGLCPACQATQKHP